jgi:ABC-type polar amino acid transport system ATPase subunit
MTLLLARDISVRRGAATLLAEASLACAPGQCVAVIGDNGSGKTTLLRALAGFEPGASGSLTFKDRLVDLAEGEPEPVLWPDLTIVLQGLALWPNLTARENILMPWRQRDPAARLSESDLNVLIEAFDLASLLTRRPAAISGGQRQRVALARAFALNPRCLLLDEPSSALDARHTAGLVAHIQMAKARGTGIVCVTHNLGLAAKIADTFCFMADGRTLVSGAWSDVTRTGVGALDAFLDLHSLR